MKTEGEPEHFSSGARLAIIGGLVHFITRKPT